MTPRGAGGRRSRHGFTLLELVVTLLILTAIIVVVGLRSGTFSFWKDEGLVRRLSELSTFLHHQAVVDQRFYALRFRFGQNGEADSFTVGTFAAQFQAQPQPNNQIPGSPAPDDQGGRISNELSQFLTPALGADNEMAPPPDFPSLAEEQPFPPGTTLTDVRTLRGPMYPQDGEAYILYSPRGFSEFSVIHLRLSNGEDVTILVNPWTGNPEIYRGYREFEWTFGREQQ